MIRTEVGFGPGTETRPENETKLETKVAEMTDPEFFRDSDRKIVGRCGQWLFIHKVVGSGATVKATALTFYFNGEKNPNKTNILLAATLSVKVNRSQVYVMMCLQRSDIVVAECILLTYQQALDWVKAQVTGNCPWNGVKTVLFFWLKILSSMPDNFEFICKLSSLCTFIYVPCLCTLFMYLVYVPYLCTLFMYLVYVPLFIYSILPDLLHIGWLVLRD